MGKTYQKLINLILMNPGALAFLIPIVAITGGIIMIIFLRKYENEERMAMIEKGMNPGLPAFSKPKSNPSATLRFALLAIGAGLGLLVGNFLVSTTDMYKPVAFFSMILLFGGFGLLMAYLIELRQEERQKREKEREMV